VGLEGLRVFAVIVVGYEAAPDRAGGLVAVRPEPLAIVPELLARVDRRQRRRYPAGLQRVRRIGAAAASHETELLAGLEDRRADLILLCIGTPDLEPGGARHAAAQGAHGPAANPHGGHVEELQLLERATVQLLDDRPRLGALDLEAPHRACDWLSHRAHRRAVVELHLDVVAAGRRMKAQPVRGRRPADVQTLL